MMNMQSRNQYLKELRTEYLQTKGKKERGKLLNESEKRTGLKRKCLIKKLKPLSNLDKKPEERKKRREKYDGPARNALATCWKIFDHPCGQRLEPLLQTEVDRLRNLGELICSDEVARKLKEIDASTIDDKLKHVKEVERQKRKYHRKIHPLLYQRIPVKVFSEQDRMSLGNIQIDLVEHCGSSASGEFIHTLSTTDIASGWWEGEAVMGRGQEQTREGVANVRSRYPFHWKGIHSDNGTEFINAHLFRYAKKEGVEFSRSRPYKKNDNCLVEQKNWTHVKKFVGYHRYDTQEELNILNDLYSNELRLFKNFFQPVIKLVSKERIQGKIRRKYDQAKTPYQRCMEASEVPEGAKRMLQTIYVSLNPAQLKRMIDEKLDLLWKAYLRKSNSQTVESTKKQRPVTVSFLNRQPIPVSVS